VCSVVEGDFGGLAEGLRQAGFPVAADADIGTLLELAGVLLGTHPTADPANVGHKLGQAIGDVPVELLTVGRALSLLSAITRELDPELDVLGIAFEHASRSSAA
jgi:hypothetical protein